MECGNDEEMLLRWCRSNPISVCTLPLAIVGSGNSNLPAKIEALAHSVKLDVSGDPQVLEQYCQSCVSVCTDYGTESQIPEVAWIFVFVSALLCYVLFWQFWLAGWDPLCVCACFIKIVGAQMLHCASARQHHNVECLIGAHTPRPRLPDLRSQHSR